MTASSDRIPRIRDAVFGRRIAPEWRDREDVEEALMPAKVAIIEQIGERGLLLPELIARGLASNDRLEYYLALLQAAQARAQAPQEPASNLRVQREACGIADASLDSVVESSSDRGNHTTYIPGACVIIDRVFEELRRMLSVLEAAGPARPELRERAALYLRRLDELNASVPCCPDDLVADSAISGLTSLSRNGHDTVHQLIVDLHGELGSLQEDVLPENVDGARAYGLTDPDRALVSAFMAGVKDTAGLKFDHPGLGTTAARDGRRLSIQNDLGSTEAHVVVVHVAELTVTITYTDVHRSRVAFFQDLLQAYRVTWTPAPMAPGSTYEMTEGRYVAQTPGQLTDFLTFIGSRLVFLIDWNRARKRLARMVSKSEAVGLLKWAADNNIGHRAFLQAGDIQLIERAFDRAVPLQTRLGTRLDELLGRQAARLFLMSVLRTASAGLSAGHSTRLVEDKVEAELLRYLETPERHVLAGVAEHATMIAALAERVRQEFTRRKNHDGGDHAPRTTELAHVWTARADEMLRHETRYMESTGGGQQLRPLLTEAGGAACALEETAFMLPLIPGAIDPRMLSLLEGLADQVGATAREYVRCLEEGQDLSRSSDRRDVDSFLVTIDRLAALGRQTNLSRRAITERILRGSGDCHELYVLTTLADGFDRAATMLARCGSIVRDEVLRTRLTR
jgi:hypothetical protein